MTPQRARRAASGATDLASARDAVRAAGADVPEALEAAGLTATDS